MASPQHLLNLLANPINASNRKLMPIRRLSSRLALCAGLFLASTTWAASCSSVVETLNQTLKPRINDTAALADTLSTLAQTSQLPARFVTKRQAQAAGWHPGSSLWAVLPGKSIGGDRFGNYQHRLDNGSYQEADLDYTGNKRGAKRLIFSRDGRRFITVDHYQTFTQVPSCQ